MKKKEHRMNTLLVVCALVLLGYTVISMVQELASWTGRATTQTTTINLTVLAANATNVTANATSGGNSGGGPSKQGSLLFTTSLSFINLKLMVGEQAVQTLRIKNTADLTLDFFVSSNSENVVVEQSSFRLPPGNEREIAITLIGGKTGINTALITIKTAFAEKVIPVIMEVQSENAAFTVDLFVPSAFRTIKPSGEIFSTTTISNLDGGYIDLRYVLINAANKIVYEEQEQVKVTNVLVVDKTLKVPSYLEQGSYAFGVIATYGGETQADSALITIKSSAKQPKLEQPLPPPKKSSFLLLAIIFFLIIHHIMKKRMRKTTL